jgi:DNA-binding SARP family transcriptional activator/tetratricopeptide (TPR) repeat protein
VFEIPEARDVDVRLLGSFELVADGEMRTIRAELLRTLLAVLAMAVPKPVPTSTLGVALWGLEPPANVKGALHTYVSRLRQVVGNRIVTERDGYRLAVEADAVDALRFLRASASAGQASRDDVSQMLGLWRGKAFDHVRSDWLESRYGSELTERHLVVLERRIDLDVADGRSAELIAELSALVDRYSLRETLWVRLLLALERSGRRAEALERYEVVRLRLAEELGVSPGTELRRTHERLLAADATSTHTRPTSVPRQLPSDFTQFTGREEALRDLDALLPRTAVPGQPVVIAAVHGTAGVGKTALAVHWAHRIHEHFPDGQLFLNLRGYGPGRPVEPPAALDTLLRCLGMSGQEIPEDSAARSLALRSMLADRRVLLILDNARDPEQVRPLLPGSSCMVVVTSRNRMRGLAVRDGAHRIDLSPLAPGEAVTLLTSRLRHRGVPYAEQHLAELAELSGHLPLALAIVAEHAASHLGAGPAALVEQLRHRRSRLDRLDLADPPSSLRAVFSWSYLALEADEARCFRLLGLHAGPDFSSHSAAALLGVPVTQARRSIDRLVDAHLVHQTASDRFVLHDLLRLYASELDLEPELDPALRRGYDWYLHSAAAARAVTGALSRLVDIGEPVAGITPTSFTDETAAHEWLDRERANLIAAVHDAAARRHDRATYRLAQLTHTYLWERGALTDIFELQDLALTAARRSSDESARAVSHNQLGVAYIRRADWDRAEEHLRLACRIFEAEGHDLGHLAALGNLGSLYRLSGRPTESVQMQERSIEIARRTGDSVSEGTLMNKLALALVDLATYDRAITIARRSTKLLRSAGTRWQEASATDTLGQALDGRGEHAAAVDAYHRALDGFRYVGDSWSECIVLTHLGIAQRAAGQQEAARASWRSALQIYDQTGAVDSGELRRSDLVTLLAAPAEAN